MAHDSKLGFSIGNYPIWLFSHEKRVLTHFRCIESTLVQFPHFCCCNYFPNFFWCTYPKWPNTKTTIFLYLTISTNQKKNENNPKFLLFSPYMSQIWPYFDFTLFISFFSDIPSPFSFRFHFHFYHFRFVSFLFYYFSNDILIPFYFLFASFFTWFFFFNCKFVEHRTF